MPDLGSSPWSMGLPWLQEFAPTPRECLGYRQAISIRCPGVRRELATSLGAAEGQGIDMVHAAVNEVLARRALPRTATLSIAAPAKDAEAVGIVAGIVRACRGHGILLAVPLAFELPELQIAVSVAGAVVGEHQPHAGDRVLALRSAGPTDGDFAPLAAWAGRLAGGLASKLADGETIGRVLVAPRTSHASVLHDPVQQGWPFWGVAVLDGDPVGRLGSSLPQGLDVVWDFAAWRPSVPFGEWLGGVAPGLAAASTCSLGIGFLLAVPPDQEQKFLDWFAAWGEPATRVGDLVDKAPGR